jgi:curved DNA-binding protein CbpA
MLRPIAWFGNVKSKDSTVRFLMIASHDDREITYYDELGVAPDASPDEIRDAFRLFVRLLHPDQQTDPQLKEIAEKQMRKLNRIHAVLSDPDSRRRYDEILDTDFAPPIIINSLSPGPRRLGATLAWAAAIVVSAGLLIWLASDNTSGVQSRAFDPSSTPATTSAFAPAPAGKNAGDQDSGAGQISQLRSDLRAVIVERDAAIQELNKLRGNPDNRTRQALQSGGTWPIDGTEPKPAMTMTELPSASKLPILPNSAPPRIERPANRQLAGFWFYAKPPDGQTNKNQSLYPPEYIEATITEDGGAIHGRYRSRFQIVDRAISPDVNFTFTGTPNGSQCNCLWTGAAGARGELTLKLTSDNAMRIDWTASELGSLQGLSSGTAVLTRRIE